MKNECPNWARFLSESIGDEQAIGRLRGWMKELLAGEAPARALVLVGSGLGKSTLAEVLAEAVGRHAVGSVEDFESPYSMAVLKEKRLNVCDGHLNRITRSTTFKSILAADLVLACRKHRAPEAVIVDCALVVTHNCLPATIENKLFRRLVVIFFEGVAARDADPLLLDRLLEELPKIVEWTKE